MAVDVARVKSLFLTASDLPDLAERAAYLDRECGGDADLRARVEALLRANDAAPLPPAGAAEATGAYTPNRLPETEDFGDPTARVGAILAGKYKLVEAIGEGGMGSVYMAQQTEPVKRAVAVKVIKAGMDSKAVLARFEAERQALAMMDHPNIAKVLDAGTTEGGRPFFVMELVKGQPITKFCDARKLTPRQRLELFVPVCQAIQHAHQKGIIHRDIKPSNVLVALYDDKPVPKVIDFGLAKAAGPTLTEQTLMTGFGAVVGTPEYMSPEQANLNNLDIDTRSDVYSLGVLLYELLTGTTPVDRKSLGKAALLEILRIVREVEAPKPSAKLSTSDTLPSVAANRSTEPGKLSKLMKGELDWVLLKALEKDRTRRYETANALARDLQRYLADEMVEARPPSFGYRAHKFLRRHKGTVFAASLVFLALVAGLAASLWQMNRAITAERETAEALFQITRERDAKEKARAAEAEQRRFAQENEIKATVARQHAETNLGYATKGNAILGSVFEGLDPKANYASVAELRNALRDNLNKAVKELEGSAIGDPLIVAEMQHRLGNSLLSLGEAKLASEVLKNAAQTHKARLGPDHELTLTVGRKLVDAYRVSGKLDVALPLAEELLRLTKSNLGHDHPDTLVSMGSLAKVYHDAGKPDLALPLFEEALKRLKAKYGTDHPDTITGMNNLAAAYCDAGKLDLALPLVEESYHVRKAKLGPDHPRTLEALNNLAAAYWQGKQLDKSIPLFEEALKLTTAKLGRDHPKTLMILNNLGVNYKNAGRLKDAISLLEEAYRGRLAKLGPSHLDTLSSMDSLAGAYQEAEKSDLALPLFEETLKLEKSSLGLDHPLTLKTMGNLAVAYWHGKQLDKSLPLFEETLRLQQKKLGRDHPDTLVTLLNLGINYKDAGRPKDAIPLLEEAYHGFTKLSPKYSERVISMYQLAGAYTAAGKLDQALPLYEESFPLQKTMFGSDDPETLRSMGEIGFIHWKRQQFDKSIPLFEEKLKLEEKKRGRNHPDTLNTMANLGVNYKDAGRLKEAIPLLEEAYAAAKKHPDLSQFGPSLLEAYEKTGENAKATNLLLEQLPEARKALPNESPQLAGLLAQTASLFLEQKKWTEAEPLLRECLAIREKKEPDDWRTFNTQSSLGGALLGQKKYAEAEPLLLKGYEGMKQREKTIPPQAGIRLPDALDRLIELYTATNKPDEVKKWQAERAKYAKTGTPR